MARQYAIDMTGQTFGFLTVTRREGSVRLKSKKKYAQWLCKCACGQEVLVRGQSLRRGLRKACAVNGHHWTARKTPELTRLHEPEYDSWRHMLDRCENPKHKNYYNYGGRGITVCYRWQDFTVFLEDMGPKPDPLHTIERNDNNRGYDPGNCRWVPRPEQYRNMRRNVYVEYQGERLLLLDLCARLGVNRGNVYGRLKNGWALEKALSVPIYKKREPPPP